MLNSQIQAYKNAKIDYNSVPLSVPSAFFEDLTKHHEQLLLQYENMTKEAESIVETMYEQKDQPAKMNFIEMKRQVYEFCEEIFRQ